MSIYTVIVLNTEAQENEVAWAAFALWPLFSLLSEAHEDTAMP